MGMLSRLSPLRRTALISVAAAAALVAVKLITAIQTHSLGLFAETVHSGTDLVTAILTFFAVGGECGSAALAPDWTSIPSTLVAPFE